MRESKGKVSELTHNFWTGCDPVDEGCLHCYARADFKEWRRNFDKVQRTKDWKSCFTYQRKLARERRTMTVFCCSYSDFFHPDADQWRDEAWEIVRNTPNLLWRFLTKRAELMPDRLPKDWGQGYPNVCLGVTVTMKKNLPRMDILREIPVPVRLVMCEPLLEDLTPEIADHLEGFHWLAVGGESGNGTMDFRPMNEQWARNLRDLCAARGIPFYFKQHAGMWPQTGEELDGIEYRQTPTAWKSYQPAFIDDSLPGQVSLIPDIFGNQE
jgi:protein gp37